MSRIRALLAMSLALAWCSAVLHVELEAVGLMLDHQHHGEQDRSGSHHEPGIADDHHDPLFTSNIAKDGLIRLGATGAVCFALVGVLAFFGTYVRSRSSAGEPVPIGRQSDPPLQKIWQFVQRCAPESAAPPALG